MKVIKVIKELQDYVDKFGDVVEVDFKMVAPENLCDDDSMDIDINYEGEIGTSLLNWDREIPVVEIGFTYNEKKDWSTEWNYYGNNLVYQDDDNKWRTKNVED